jgi:hypothetical protein
VKYNLSIKRKRTTHIITENFEIDNSEKINNYIIENY